MIWLIFKFILTILSVMCLPIAAFVLLFLLIYKQVVRLMAKRFQKFVEPIPGPSSFFLSDNLYSSPHSVIVVALGLDRICSKNDVARWFQQGYDIRDELGQRCYRELGYTPIRYFGYGFWEKVPNFKISLNRIKHLSETIEISENKMFMQNTAAFLQRQPFQPDEPLWDVNLHYNHTENKTIFFLRFHHMMADGLSFIKFVYALSGCDQLPATFISPRSAFSRWNYIRKNIFGAVWTGIQLISVGTAEYLIEFFFKKDRHALHFNKSGKLKLAFGIWRCTNGKKLDLNVVKRASKRLKFSISNVFLAGVSTGLEKYFAKYYANDEPATFRYSMALPLPNHPNKRFVNCWTVGKFHSPNFNLDMHKKLEYIKNETNRLYTSILTIHSSYLFQYVSQVMPWKWLGSFCKTKAQSTITYSNVVGPQDEDKLIAGSKVTDMWFWAPIPQETNALAVGIISCNGGIRVCLTADVGSIQKQEELDDLHDMIYSAIFDIISLHP